MPAIPRRPTAQTARPGGAPTPAPPPAPPSTGPLAALDTLAALAAAVGAAATLLVWIPLGRHPVVRAFLPLAERIWWRAWAAAALAWAVGVVPRLLTGRPTAADSLAVAAALWAGRAALLALAAAGRALLALLMAVPPVRALAGRAAGPVRAVLDRLLRRRPPPPPPKPAEPDARPLFPGGPPLDLLLPPDASLAETGEGAARAVQAAFVRLGMPEIQVTGARTGPTLCTVRTVLPPGVRASQIRALADDLAAEMGVPSVSVRAAEGGGGVMLIQVPVRKRQTVRIRSVLDSPEYRSAKGLPIAVGVEAAGEPVVFDLRDAPHLLIAGTTGAGKSVFMHAVLTSLVMRFGPDQLRLILIDPKGGVELGVYAGLPHMAAPVVTDASEAPGYLDWAVSEMERRYALLAKHGVRNIVAFNQAAAGRGERPLPYIVVAIDETADLMLVAKDLVETSVVRLAQKARAAGIHLVVATQRPSKEVLTGLIRSNIPSRVAFRVAKQADSLIILDEIGAEKLLGQGDLLLKAVGADLVRAQSPFITPQEVDAVVGWWAGWAREHPDHAAGAVVAVPEARGTSPSATQPAARPTPEERMAALRHKAEMHLYRTGSATVNSIQKALGIRRQTAAELVQWLQEEGLLAPAQGVRPGRCTLDPQERRERLARMLGKDEDEVELADAGE